MTMGKIDYSPDYKSEKPERLNPRVKISATGRPYVEKADLVASALKRIKADTGTETEHARLRGAVVEAAKKWAVLRFQPHFGGMNDLENTLQGATRALIDFEASQEKDQDGP